MQLPRTLFWTVVSSLGQLVIAIFSSLIVLRWSVHFLGEQGNGVWVLVATLGELLGLLELGAGTALVRLLAEARGLGDGRAEAHLRWMATRFFRAAALGAVAFTFVIAARLDAWFHVPANLAKEGQLALIVTGLEVALTLLFAPLRVAYQVQQEFHVLNGIAAVRWVVRLLAVWWLLPLWPSPVCVAAIGLATNLLASGALYWGRKVPMAGTKPADEEEARELAQNLVSHSAWVALSLLASRLAYSMDAVVVGAALGAEEVSFYYSAWKIVEVIRNFGMAVLPWILPLAGEMHGGGQGERTREIFYLGEKLVLAVTFPLCVVALGQGDLILSWWLGERFARFYPLLVLLLVPQVVILSFYPTAPIANGIGRYREVVLYALVSGAVNFGLSVLLVRLLGLWGVALATTITLGACAVVNLFFHPWLLGISLASWASIFGRGVVILTVGVGFLRGLRSCGLGWSWELAVGCLVGGACFLAHLLWDARRATRVTLVGAFRQGLLKSTGS